MAPLSEYNFRIFNPAIKARSILKFRNPSSVSFHLIGFLILSVLPQNCISRNSRLFLDQFGIQLQKEDEMKCAVAGANFLLQAIRDEAFTFTEGRKNFVAHKFGLHADDLFPYLLVNIGSGVSIIKVDSGGFERVGGTNIGGGTFWGLCRLLTGMRDFDQMLACSAIGDNSKVDMLVGDIYGGRDYAKVGLSSTTIASSFGRVVMDEGSLADYNKADITLSLLRMISYNISHIATMTAVKHGLKRIYFGGYFIRGHAYTMNTISFAVDYWSKGNLRAMFLRHEGFLGALGAFLQDGQAQALKTSPLQGAWIEKFIRCSMPMSSDARCEAKPFQGTMKKYYNSRGSGESPSHASSCRDQQNQSEADMALFQENKPADVTARSSNIPRESDHLGAPSSDCFGDDQSGQESFALDFGSNQLLSKAGLQVGVLHLVPTLQLFPLLKVPERYEPNVLDILESREEREYWLDALHKLNPGLLEKAVASESVSPGAHNTKKSDAHKRAKAFCFAFSTHLNRLRDEPAAYGRIGLSELLEMREECLRAFGFKDVYSGIKQQENAAALAVLPDLLAELDELHEEQRALALIEGVLAGNIFDWGSQSCVDLYKNGTILEIYRNVRSSIARPWAVDYFDDFRKAWLGMVKQQSTCLARQKQNECASSAHHRRYNKALFFCDNSGADVVLGIIPFARELLRQGTDVCLVANSLPAINDVTADEMGDVVRHAAQKCELISHAIARGCGQDPGNKSNVGKLTVCASGSGSPCLDFRRVSHDLCEATRGVDLIILEGMGRAVNTNWKTKFSCDTLKLAMIKNSRLAQKLFQGKIYDCVCKFEAGTCA